MGLFIVSSSAPPHQRIPPATKMSPSPAARSRRPGTNRPCGHVAVDHHPLRAVGVHGYDRPASTLDLPVDRLTSRPSDEATQNCSAEAGWRGARPGGSGSGVGHRTDRRPPHGQHPAGRRRPHAGTDADDLAAARALGLDGLARVCPSGQNRPDHFQGRCPPPSTRRWGSTVALCPRW